VIFEAARLCVPTLPTFGSIPTFSHEESTEGFGKRSDFQLHECKRNCDTLRELPPSDLNPVFVRWTQLETQKWKLGVYSGVGVWWARATFRNSLLENTWGAFHGPKPWQQTRVSMTMLCPSREEAFYDPNHLGARQRLYRLAPMERVGIIPSRSVQVFLPKDRYLVGD
jgi:hypothetical protein